jgi:hypothetical protein
LLASENPYCSINLLSVDEFNYRIADNNGVGVCISSKK